jgi:hypothetical protein
MSGDPTPPRGSVVNSGELQAAIVKAYDIFAPYRDRFTATVCTCPACFIEADRERLLATPLQEIDGFLLDQYSWSAHDHDDDGPRSDDLRYLLPRYFELIAQNDRRLHNALECTLMQLGRTPYRTAWKAPEVEAIDRYFDALLAACLANDLVEGGWAKYSGSGFRCVARLDEVLGMMICAGADVARLLTVWDAAQEPAAALHIANLRFSLATDERGTRLHSFHLDPEHAEAALAVGAYLSSPQATARIEATFFRTTDPDAQTLMSDALFLAPAPP